MLLHDPNVPVALAEGAAGLTWIEPVDRSARWKAELESRTFDPDWTWETKRSLPLSALEFRSNDERLLLFHDGE